MENFYLSPAARARAKRRKSIAAQFPEMARKYIGKENKSPEWLFALMAQKYEMTIPGIKKILKDEGLYSCNPDVRKQYGYLGAP